MLIEVKVLFASSLAKIQFSPKLLNAEPQKHLPTELKTREVLIPTPGRAGTGGAFTHPAKLDYGNPIRAIFMAPNVRFNFETQDGVYGANINNDHNTYTRKDFNPSELKKI